MSKDIKIMYESDEAAKRVTLTGWKSRDGLFWPDRGDPKLAEHHARWSGCTHIKCECGNDHIKHFTLCHDCRRKKSQERYLSMPYKEWNGEPVCLWDDDVYFFSECDLENWAEEHDIEDISTIELIICEPQVAYEIDGNDYYQNILPEDLTVEDVSPKLAEAIDKVNKIIREENPVMCFMPGKFRTNYLGSKT